MLSRRKFFGALAGAAVVSTALPAVALPAVAPGVDVDAFALARVNRIPLSMVRAATPLQELKNAEITLSLEAFELYYLDPFFAAREKEWNAAAAKYLYGSAY